ncbi:MAG TPA: SpoIID/LytB domain-containing protein [bacterium]
MNRTVSVGLLWDEPVITGELICDFRIECRTDCCRSMTLDTTAGHFEVRAQKGKREQRYGVRLAESLSLHHAEQVLHAVRESGKAFDLEIVEAGKQWPPYDNRVWWPVVKLGTPQDADEVLSALRCIEGLNPLGFAVVRLDTATAQEMFEVSIGDFSARVMEMRATPLNPESVFWLYNVPIGRGFHWERKEQLEYRGELHLFHPGGLGLTAANCLPLETYLESAVGSEMRSDLPPAFSQAQAICARSTVLATANRHHHSDGFDVCNDDHCQCYQGVKREANAVIAPVRETAGQILISSFRVVDARYAKSCGGISERYEAAWGEEGPDYFAVRTCGDFDGDDLSNEILARNFLLNPPPAWCNGEVYPYPDPWDKDPLFRWEFSRTRAEWGELLAEKTGRNLGAIKAFHVRQRGKSGRILILEIEGEAASSTIYGELNIRRALSPSHLPSSYFVVDEHGDTLTLKGGGWGHGVGLCQLGAVAMAQNGWSVAQILDYYYPGSELKTGNEK